MLRLEAENVSFWQCFTVVDYVDSPEWDVKYFINIDDTPISQRNIPYVHAQVCSPSS